MTRIMTIPLLKTNQAFRKVGWSDTEMPAILGWMFKLWRTNDLHADMVSEFIYTELDLDAFCAASVWLDAGQEIIEAGNTVRALAVQGVLVRWNVFARLVLVELDDDSSTNAHDYAPTHD